MVLGRVVSTSRKNIEIAEAARPRFKSSTARHCNQACTSVIAKHDTRVVTLLGMSAATEFLSRISG